MLTVSDNHIVLGGGGGGGGGDVVGAASSTDNAIVRFDGVTGKLVQNSNVTISDSGVITGNGSLNITTNGEKFSFYEDDVPITDGFFKVTNATGTAETFIPTFLLKGNGANALYANGFVFDAKNDLAGNGSVVEFMARANGGAVVNRDTFVFSNLYSGSSGKQMSITASGNVGIGNIVPSAKLDIAGTTRMRGNVTFNGQIIDNVGSSGLDGQVLKKVGGQVLWSNP